MLENDGILLEMLWTGNLLEHKTVEEMVENFIRIFEVLLENC